MKVNILAQTPDGTYQQYDCDMMSILHAAPGQWRIVTDDGKEEIKQVATRTGLVSDACRVAENYTARTGLGDAFRAAMGVDTPAGGGALDGTAHTETLAELLAVGEKAPVISRSESSAPVTCTKFECGDCSLSLDGYAGDIDEDEKKSYLYSNNVGQSDGHDGDVDDDDDDDEDEDDDSSVSCEYLIIFIYSSRCARLWF